MIKVFRGNWRGIGKKENQFGMIFDFQFREIIHQFSGAKLHIFMAIALHSNENGYSWPSYDTLERHTGYTRATIAGAIEELCTLSIDGERVLERYRERDETGKFTGSNRYLIFPTPEELTNIQSLVFPTLEKSNGGRTKLKDKPIIKSGKSKPERKRDPNLDHPAIIAYREIVHLHIPTSWRQEVAETVGDVEKWKGIVKAWEGKGFKKGNVEGMLDVYVHGWKANGKTGYPQRVESHGSEPTPEQLEATRAAIRKAKAQPRVPSAEDF